MSDLLKEFLAQLFTEAAKFQAVKVDTGRIVPFKSKEARDAAIAARTHTPVPQGAKPKTRGRGKARSPSKAAKTTGQRVKKTEPSTELDSLLDIGDSDLDRLAQALKSGNAKKIRAVMQELGVTVSESGKLIFKRADASGKVKRIDPYGKSRKERAKKAALALQQELSKYGIPFEIDTSGNLFTPSKIVPPVREGEPPISVPFDQRARKNPDGSITVTFSDGDVTYEGIPNGDIDMWVKDQYDKWLAAEGRTASRSEKKQMLQQLTVAAFCINKRYVLLSKLLERGKAEGAEQVAIYDTPETKEAFVTSLESTIVGACSEREVQSFIKQKFAEYRKAKTPEEAEKILTEIVNKLKRVEDPSFRRSGAIPAIVENFTSLLEMKAGRNVIVPLRENYEASDVVSLSDVDTRGMSPTELANSLKLIYVGVSVKFEDGGSSSMIAKTEQSVFMDHKQTREDLDALCRSSSIFRKKTDTGKKLPEELKKNRARVRSVLEKNLELICKHYGIEGVTTVDQLIEFLGNGEPECDPGPPKRVIRRRIPPPPLGPGSSKDPKRAGKDPKGNPVDVPAWTLNFAMQLGWCAIYNSKVIGQSFANYTWTPSGVAKSDGVSSFSKQVAQPLKQARDKSSGLNYQPDALTTYNIPTSDVSSVRSGNPCG